MGVKTIRYSNYDGTGIDELLEEIYINTAKSKIHARVLIPYNKGELQKIIENEAEILKRKYEENGVYYEIEIPSTKYHLFRDYDIDMMVS